MTISKKTILLSLALLALIAVGLVAANPWWLLVGFAAGAGYGGYKLRKVHQSYFGTPHNHCLRRADLTDVTSPTLGHYYVHADGRNIQPVANGVYCQPPFDDQGIPLVDYGPEIGKHYNACTTSQYALEHWELFLQTGTPAYRDTFLKLADWLVQDQVEGRGITVLRTKPAG